MPVRLLTILLIFVFSGIAVQSQGQHTIARELNELVLTAIRNDYARPTIHARNLFHASIALYDTWAIYDDTAEPYLIGKTIDDFSNTLDPFDLPDDIASARDDAMVYAVYRIVEQRYQDAPKYETTMEEFNAWMAEKGYDITFESTDYSAGSGAALGNHIAEVILNYGLQDGSNEGLFHENQYYTSVNPPLVMDFDGNPDIVDPNRWQPLSLQVFIDQSGNVIPAGAESFLSPEWGDVTPFSLTDADRTTYMRDGDSYQVYLDPGPPWYIDPLEGGMDTEAYQWGFTMVARWAAHLSSDDETMIDISPGSLGNVDMADYPETLEEYQAFYNFDEGGDIGQGHTQNPSTGQPYATNMVRRGDYARVLAEFWADGPDSETPPGHWFSILNYVSDHPDFERRYRGEEVLDQLEWDVKSYLILGGAMHDSAIAAWSVKGWYDYLRPVSAIRYMCEQGQSTDPTLDNYNVAGIPLIDGFIEMVNFPTDPLAAGGENLGKIKIYTWRGPNYIINPVGDEAGVGWILAEDWWPYQRPSFVTPPFAGYVSGHSTFSRAAAEVLTLITGDAFFPGGVGEFEAEQNEFLVFEEGPSQDITLQWATYRDASDQTSLSRIWGGIHPPVDDIPGRIMGDLIGKRAVAHGETLFNLSTSTVDIQTESEVISILQNPVRQGQNIRLASSEEVYLEACDIYDLQGRLVQKVRQERSASEFFIPTTTLTEGLYIVQAIGQEWEASLRVLIL